VLRHPASLGELIAVVAGGDYRVLYSIESAGVIVRAMRHRGVAYGEHAE